MARMPEPAIIQYRFPAAQVLVEPAQAQAGSGVAPGAEGQTGVERDIDGSRIMRTMPGGNDPQALRDADRAELRLRHAHPVVVGQDGGGIGGNLLQPDGACRLLHHGIRLCAFLQQRGNPVMRPEMGCRLARFTEHGLFLRGIGIGIKYVHRQRTQVKQSFAQPLGLISRCGDRQRKPGHVILP